MYLKIINNSINYFLFLFFFLSLFFLSIFVKNKKKLIFFISINNYILDSVNPSLLRKIEREQLQRRIIMSSLNYDTKNVGSQLYYFLENKKMFDFNGSPVLLQAMLEYFQFSKRQIQSIKNLVRFWGLGGVSGNPANKTINRMIRDSPPQW
tara:strand:+ start:799 stop:1251 length:453 start_codon:yes stop_codon:yes gene_type:complete